MAASGLTPVAGGITGAKKSLQKVIADYDAAKLLQVADALADALEFAIDRSPVDAGLYKASWEIVAEPGGAPKGGQVSAVMGKSQTADTGNRLTDQRQRLKAEWKKERRFFPVSKLNPTAGPDAVKFFKLSAEFRDRLRQLFAGVSPAGRVGEGRAEMGTMDAGRPNTVYLFNASPYARFVESGNGKTKGARTMAKTRQFLNRRLKALYIQRP